MSEFQKDELSLEETNLLRAKLGLKPLLDDAPSSNDSGQPAEEDEDAVASRNFASKRQVEQRAAEAERVKERLERAQTKRELARQLAGPTLGQQDADEKQDPLKWLKTLRKKERLNAQRRAQQIEDEEQQIQQQYSEHDLQGLRVAHDLEEFDEGQERILTLRDSRILDGEDDELMDSMLEQKERDRLNAQRKKGKKGYNGLDDEEEMGAGKRGVLSKYDEEIDHDGLTKGEGSGFTLGAAAKPTQKEAMRQEHEQAAKAANKQLLSLDYAKNQDVSDYLQEGDVGFKKPKLKKRKKAAKVKLDFDDDDAPVAGSSNGAPMEEEEPAIHIRKPRTAETDNFVDDDELQASLAKARRQKAKRTFTKMTPEMIAQNLKAQREVEEAESKAREEEEKGLTFDETTEFVRAINHRPSEVEERRRTATPAAAAAVKESVEPQLQTVEEAPVETPAVKEEASDEEMSYEAEAEPVVSRGLASTLAVLRNQGMLPTVSEEEKRRERSQREYDNWLATRRHEEQMRALELKASKASGTSKDQATRELENRRREAELARTTTDRFKDYKPDFDIKYHDEFGRDLTPHEAWKQLSHVFHGKKPGAKKQEKRKKKIEEERKKEKMEAGDTPTGMIRAFRDRAERSGQAHMVLSVGNRASAPQDLPLLGPNEVYLQQQQKKGKAKVQENGDEEVEQTPVAETPVEPTPAPALAVTSSKGGGWAAVGRSSSTSTPQPDDAQPQPQRKFKLAFGTKRKAEDPQP